MRIAVDAMGGDRAPEDVIAGVRQFLAEDSATEILLTGRRDMLEEPCADLPVTIVDASTVVDMHESATIALKTRRDSSIAVAVSLVKEKKADALLTMGNSGAAVAFAIFCLGRMANISRPGIVAPMPTLSGCTLLLDVGANVDCKPIHLLHFALMGEVYYRHTFGVASPRVGLLSIGEEKSKGNELTFAAAKLLEKAPINFIGNVEGVDIMRGSAEVVVCDGFVGNVILKFGEGLVEMFSKTLKTETDLVLGEDMDRAHRMELFQETMRRVDYTAYGGAILLGVNGHCLIGHGRSGPRAIANGIRAARDAAEKCPLNEIQKALAAAAVPA
ncbi:MAG: phosphate acyltransferase PlsX [Candidatus Omnitrophota bacterium]|jgi:glycerol-3-phosphate acyltransferase PlsX|nr:MAG: phosphate acyltransferase PlsX [Candidatus Omnitrophota bacterium]